MLYKTCTAIRCATTLSKHSRHIEFFQPVNGKFGLVDFLFGENKKLRDSLKNKLATIGTMENPTVSELNHSIMGVFFQIKRQIKAIDKEHDYDLTKKLVGYMVEKQQIEQVSTYIKSLKKFGCFDSSTDTLYIPPFLLYIFLDIWKDVYNMKDDYSILQDTYLTDRSRWERFEYLSLDFINTRLQYILNKKGSCNLEELFKQGTMSEKLKSHPCNESFELAKRNQKGYDAMNSEGIYLQCKHSDSNKHLSISEISNCVKKVSKGDILVIVTNRRFSENTKKFVESGHYKEHYDVKVVLAPTVSWIPFELFEQAFKNENGYDAVVHSKPITIDIPTL